MPVVRRLVDRAHAEGSLRPDVTAEDVPLLLTMISEVALHSREVSPRAWTRYLQIMIDGLRNAPGAGDLARHADDRRRRRRAPAAVAARHPAPRL